MKNLDKDIIFNGFKNMLVMFNTSLVLVLALSSIFRLSINQESELFSSIWIGYGVITFLQSLFNKDALFQTPNLIILPSLLTIYLYYEVFIGKINLSIVNEYLSGGFIIGGIFFIIVSKLNIMKYIMKYITPTVAFSVMFMVCFYLIRYVLLHSVNDWVISIATVLLIIICSIKMNKTYLNIYSFLFTFIIIYVICFSLSYSNLLQPLNNSYISISSIKNASWLNTNIFFPWGFPNIDYIVTGILFFHFIMVYVFTIINIYIYNMISSDNTIKYNDSFGILGYSTIISTIFGILSPSVSYEHISLVKNKSKYSMIFTSFLLIIMGLSGKFTTFAATIPNSLINGIFLCTIAMMFSTTFKILSFVNLNETRNLSILGITLVLSLSLTSWTPIQDYVSFYSSAKNISYLYDFNEMIVDIIKTPILTSFFIPIILEYIIPKNKKVIN